MQIQRRSKALWSKACWIKTALKRVSKLVWILNENHTQKNTQSFSTRLIWSKRTAEVFWIVETPLARPCKEAASLKKWVQWKVALLSINPLKSPVQITELCSGWFQGPSLNLGLLFEFCFSITTYSSRYNFFGIALF